MERIHNREHSIQKLKQSYESSKSRLTLTKIIGLVRQERSQSTGSERYPYWCGQLGQFLLDYGIQQRSTARVDEAIECSREALSYPQEDHQLIQCSHTYARGLLAKYTIAHASIDPLQELIDSQTPSASDYIKTGQKLTDAKRIDLFEILTETQDVVFLERISEPSASPDYLLLESVRLRKAYLSLLPPEHPRRVYACERLASGLSGPVFGAYRLRGHHHLLEEDIQFLRAARSLCANNNDDPLMPQFLTQLGVCLEIQFNLTGDIRSLLEAIKLDKDACERCYHHPTLQGKVWINRALHCVMLYEASHKLDPSHGDLDHFHGSAQGSAVQTLSSLRLMSDFSLHRSTGHHLMLEEKIFGSREAIFNIDSSVRDLDIGARALLGLWKTSAEPSLLEVAVQLQEIAFNLTSDSTLNRSNIYDNYAELLYHQARSGHHDAISQLQMSIALTRKAISLCAINMNSLDRESAQAAFSVHLAVREMLLHELKCEVGQETCLESTMRLCNETFIMSSQDHHWTSCLIQASIYLHRKTDPKDALMLLSRTLDDKHITDQDITSILNQLMKLVEDSHKIYGVRVESVLFPLLTRLIGLMPRVAAHALSRRMQLHALHRFRHLGVDTFHSALAVCNIDMGLELMEQAHGILWSQAMHIRDPNVSSLPPELAAEMVPLINPIRGHLLATADNHDRPTSAEHQTGRNAQNYNGQRLDQLVANIHAISGLERFWLGNTIQQLKQTAKHHPVVILIEGRYQHRAVLIKSPSDDIEVLPIDIDPRNNPLDNLYLGTRGSQQELEITTSEEERGMKLRQMHRKSLDLDKLQLIWAKIVKPLVRRLGLSKCTGRNRPRLHWCPTGAFSLLPLHAAGSSMDPGIESCADYFVSSYTPTLSALLRAQDQSYRGLKVCEADLLLVAESIGNEAQLRPIHGVEEEIDIVRHSAESHGVDQIITYRRGAATLEAITGDIKTSRMVHLACHGTQDVSDPLSSGFHLRDGKLTISQLMDIELSHPFLAYLSACQTATGDQNQPDQVMHLAAAMLFIGFPSVIATMWSISDTDGPSAAQTFDHELFSESAITTHSIPYALDAAIAKLRQSGATPERWAPFIHMGA